MIQPVSAANPLTGSTKPRAGALSKIPHLRLAYLPPPITDELNCATEPLLPRLWCVAVPGIRCVLVTRIIPLIQKTFFNPKHHLGQGFPDREGAPGGDPAAGPVREANVRDWNEFRVTGKVLFLKAIFCAFRY